MISVAHEPAFYCWSVISGSTSSMLLIDGLFIIRAVDVCSHVDFLVLFSSCLVGVCSFPWYTCMWRTHNHKFSMASYLLFLTLLLVWCTLWYSFAIDITLVSKLLFQNCQFSDKLCCSHFFPRRVISKLYVKTASIPVEISLSQGRKFSQKPSGEDCDWKDTN